MTRSLLLTFDYPPIISGIGTVFYELWKRFPKERMIILAPRVHGASDADRLSARPPIRIGLSSAGTLAKIVNMKLMFLKALWMVLQDGLDEIHAGQAMSCGPVGYLMQVFTRVPCYLWVYGGETGPEYHRNPVTGAVMNHLLRTCRYLVTNSPVVTEEMREFGIPADRIVEITPGVDTVRFSPGAPDDELRDRLGLKDQRVLLTVARLTERKGHDLVLKALSQMDSSIDISYVIVGDGPDRGRLEALTAGLGLTGKVIFAGRVSDAELPLFYRLCDIYVMPGRYVAASTDSVEGFGISFIEANACGKPVIGGCVGGTGAAVADGVSGYLIDPENVGSFAGCVLRLLDDPDLSRQLGQQGRERAVNDFSWDDRARQLASRLQIDIAPRVAGNV